MQRNIIPLLFMLPYRQEYFHFSGRLIWHRELGLVLARSAVWRPGQALVRTAGQEGGVGTRGCGAGSILPGAGEPQRTRT